MPNLNVFYSHLRASLTSFILSTNTLLKIWDKTYYKESINYAPKIHKLIYLWTKSKISIWNLINLRLKWKRRFLICKRKQHWITLCDKLNFFLKMALISIYKSIHLKFNLIWRETIKISNHLVTLYKGFKIKYKVWSKNLKKSKVKSKKLNLTFRFTFIWVAKQEWRD